MADEKGQAAELKEIHRARNPEEAQAWTDLRDGRVADALNWYRDQGLLRLYDTRQELRSGMLDEWWAAGPDRGVLVVDSSNDERDELNAQAQARRLQAGELGAEALPLENGRELRAGDRVIFTDIYQPAADNPTAQRPKRVENGTGATVLSLDLDAGIARLRLYEPKRKRGPAKEERELTVPGSAPIQLGYARHVVKAQGMTANVANVATGPPHRPQRALCHGLAEPRGHADSHAPDRGRGDGCGRERADRAGAAGRHRRRGADGGAGRRAAPDAAIRGGRGPAH